MLLSQHAIVGGAVGLATGNPFLGFLAGFMSHHILDRLPHVDGVPEKSGHERYSSVIDREWPLSTYITAYIDVAVTVIIIIFVALRVNEPLIFLCGAFGGSLPDLMDNVPFWRNQFRLTGFGKWYHGLHNRFHFRWHNAYRYQLGLAILLQLILTLGGVWVSLRG